MRWVVMVGVLLMVAAVCTVAGSSPVDTQEIAVRACLERCKRAHRDPYVQGCMEWECNQPDNYGK